MLQERDPIDIEEILYELFANLYDSYYYYYEDTSFTTVTYKIYCEYLLIYISSMSITLTQSLQFSPNVVTGFCLG